MSTVGAGRLGGMIGRMIAEFLVIVMGVLVALGVDGYASTREDRARIEIHLAQLEIELDEMARSLDGERENYDLAYQASRTVVEGVTNPGSVSGDSLTAVFPNVFVSRAWEPEATVINTMILSGDIALVADRVLQSELNRFRERIQAVAYRRDLAVDLRFRNGLYGIANGVRNHRIALS